MQWWHIQDQVNSDSASARLAGTQDRGSGSPDLRGWKTMLAASKEMSPSTSCNVEVKRQANPIHVFFSHAPLSAVVAVGR